ncbi:MAG: GNAT family N-acetyltransferase [Coriobacteriia bacterium]|nr:GNAT family N-acetyltransferase [Coriobacteriia bacterium]
MIRPLAGTDDLSGFSCGSHELDRYLKTYALPNATAGVSVTYVHVDGTGATNGYLTLAGTSIRSCEAPAALDLPSYPLPALLVARLAVHADSQRRGIGHSLLTFALEEALVLYGRTGCVAIVVDAKPEAVVFYQRFGFEPIHLVNPTTGTIRMLLETGSVLDALT